MADNTNLTRTYTIPLRKRFVDVPRYKRAKRAVKTVRAFLERHMKSEDVKIGPNLNTKLWAHGIKNPPAKVIVTATKDKNGVVKAELEGYSYVEFKVEEKTPDKNASMQEKLKQKVQDAKSGTSKEEPESTEQEAATQSKQESADSPKKETASKKTASKKTSSSTKTATKKSTKNESAAKKDSDQGSSDDKKDTEKKSASATKEE